VGEGSCGRRVKTWLSGEPDKERLRLSGSGLNMTLRPHGRPLSSFSLATAPASGSYKKILVYDDGSLAGQTREAVAIAVNPVAFYVERAQLEEHKVRSYKIQEGLRQILSLT
jgi:hypothetical protein